MEPVTQDVKQMSSSSLDVSIRKFEEHLTHSLAPAIVKFFVNLFDSVSQDPKKKGDNLIKFQVALREIEKYSRDRVSQAATDVSSWLSPKFDLASTLRVIFLCRTQIIASLRPQHRATQQLQIPIPSVDTFIHKVLSLSARSIFISPSLFDKSPDTNKEDVRLEKFNRTRSIIFGAINDSIVALTPHHEVIATYLSDTAQSTPLQSPSSLPPISQPPTPQVSLPPPVSYPPEPQLEQPEQPIESKAGFKKTQPKKSKVAVVENDDDESDATDDDDDDSGDDEDDSGDDDDGNNSGDESPPVEPVKKKGKTVAVKQNRRREEPTVSHKKSKHSKQ